MLKDITFGYSRLSNPLIENFSITIEPGQKIAFVGATGAGKTTITNLINRFYDIKITRIYLRCFCFDAVSIFFSYFEINSSRSFTLCKQCGGAG